MSRFVRRATIFIEARRNHTKSLAIYTVVAVAVLVGCGGGSGPSATAPSTPPPTPMTDRAAARFLEQASFGPTPADIAHLKAVGFNAWLDEQFAAPTTDLPSPGPGSALDTIQSAFFANALSAPDQLRQRVSFALSQVYVVSDQKVDNRIGVVDFYRVLLKDCFGPHQRLLKDVTVAPAMGRYLDMVDNTKADPASGTSPNENYAREVLQLFSIGLTILNADGTAALDATGKPIASYDQNTVEGFARTFTGWTFAPAAGQSSQDFNPENFSAPMVSHETYHETAAKVLLNGFIQPAGQSAPMDLDAAVANIVKHGNVGPFLATRLIQALVKSNPSGSYVQRVSIAYADNGAGVRGDMKAVIKAVLLDPEARTGDTQAPGASDGKMREPVIYMTRLLRAFNVKSTGSGLPNYSQAMRQDIFNSPSVFNFYPPSYKPKATTLRGPEFKIVNAPTLASRLSFASDLSVSGLPAGTSVDLSDLVATTADPAALVRLLDNRLMHGAAPDRLKATTLQAINSAGSSPSAKASVALYVFAASPSFWIQR